MSDIDRKYTICLKDVDKTLGKVKELTVSIWKPSRERSMVLSAPTVQEKLRFLILLQVYISRTTEQFALWT